MALAGRRLPASAVTLEFPLQGGTFYVAQGGSNALLNGHHRYGSQTYAVDVLRVDRAGRRARGVYPADVSRYLIWGETVHSPCDGTVAAAVDGLPDVRPGSPADASHPAGNHVYIDCRDQGVQVLLAHMLAGSMQVAAGDDVAAGDPVGRAGNSGNTSEPHLHIHARTGGTLEDPSSGSGVPILFKGRFLVRNDTVDSPRGAE
jgi:hypothetical protein